MEEKDIKKMMTDRPIVVVPPEEPALPGYRAEKALVNNLWSLSTLTDIDLTYLRRVTSWEAPNIATPLREASKGKGIDWKKYHLWKRSKSRLSRSHLEVPILSCVERDASVDRETEQVGGHNTQFLTHPLLWVILLFILYSMLWWAGYQVSHANHVLLQIITLGLIFCSLWSRPMFSRCFLPGSLLHYLGWWVQSEPKEPRVRRCSCYTSPLFPYFG